MDITHLAREVERTKQQYERAVRALADALGPLAFSGPVNRPTASKPHRRRSGPSVASRVLQLIQADPDGATRAELVSKLGSDSAVHAALKQAKRKGLAENVDGRWKTPKPKAPPVKARRKGAPGAVAAPA